jgi:hypothetical protein
MCDSCAIGYWGLRKIIESNNVGCLRKYSTFLTNSSRIYVLLYFKLIACFCNKLGSLREDFNQDNGVCECKPGYIGKKCDILMKYQEFGYEHENISS